MISDVAERFERYVQIDTVSHERTCDVTPSTPGQFDLAHLLVDELHRLGLTDATCDEHCYVCGHLEATEGSKDKETLGLIAHLDTAEDAPGHNVSPERHIYLGVPIMLSSGAVLDPDNKGLVGAELITSDGTTLLGSDDKAGIAEIMALLAYLQEHPEIKHPRLAIAFPPDEEIGHGAALLDLKAFDAAYGYTIDGGALGGIEYECFNAASAVVQFQGHAIHPGSAKDTMVNALHLFSDFDAYLPAAQRPVSTEQYEGFYHLLSVSGTVDHASARYIVRDHDDIKFAARKKLMKAVADNMNTKLDTPRVSIEIEDQYFNMATVIKDHMHLISNAEKAFKAAEITPYIAPIRGGTDGAQLSFRGLPCPNLSTGGYNFHSMSEFIPVKSLEGMSEMLVKLVQIYA